MSKIKVLIVGGGFAGVKAALKLVNHPEINLTMLSDDTSLRYYPTLYRVATGGSSAEANIPYESIFRDSNINLVKGVAKTIDRQNRQIITDEGKSYEYDFVILALGVVTNYFGIPGLSDYSFSIKSQAEAQRFKKHLHQQLIDTGRPDTNYLIVGAGPTGIELAGALPAYLKRITKSHGLDVKHLNIALVEAMPRLLPNLSKTTTRQVSKRLHQLGIKLYLNSKVEGQSADALTVNGRPLPSQTVVWTAGVTNHPFFKDNNFVIMGRGKVGVDAYLQTEPKIFVVGDNANTPFSGMAQTALHDGEFVANNLIKSLKGEMYSSYEVKKPTTVIPVGPNWAVVERGNFHLKGRLGSLIRESADLKGFKDLEPLGSATQQLLRQFSVEDYCQICATALARY